MKAARKMGAIEHKRQQVRIAVPQDERCTQHEEHCNQIRTTSSRKPAVV
jgi:hypothetical protein